jgi:hypothetical protein
MSLLGWRQWAVDRDGLLRPAWTPWSPFPEGLLWRPDGLTRARCLRDDHLPGGGPAADGPAPATTSAGLPRRPIGRHLLARWAGLGSRPGAGPSASNLTAATNITATDTTASHPAASYPTAGDASTSRSTAAGASAAGGRDAGGEVPGDGCACGLYAWRDPETLAKAPFPRWTRRPIVIGVARLGGRVIVGERGYRAELGYPVAVLDPAGVIAPGYQVARYREWRALVAEWRSEANAA